MQMPSERARFFQDHGWLQVDSVLTRAEAEEAREQLLELASKNLGTKDRHVAALATNDYQRMAKAVNEPSRISEFFRKLATSPKIGALMREILEVKEVRLFRDLGLIKQPTSEDGIATGVHQDQVFYPLDRKGVASVWIALVDLPSNSGTMRFVDRSHKNGPVGRYVLPGRDWLAAHPEDAKNMTPAPALTAGSATIHDGYTLHGSDPNTWDKPRIAYTLAYFRSDALFNGMPSRWTDGLGLKVDEPIEHELFPIVA
jgi:ectoine hydroxylase-related dioxygenase (phytanoyl-CoA dioxygenase family)